MLDQAPPWMKGIFALVMILGFPVFLLGTFGTVQIMANDGFTWLLALLTLVCAGSASGILCWLISL